MREFQIDFFVFELINVNKCRSTQANNRVSLHNVVCNFGLVRRMNVAKHIINIDNNLVFVVFCDCEPDGKYSV